MKWKKRESVSDLRNGASERDLTRKQISSEETLVPYSLVPQDKSLGMPVWVCSNFLGWDIRKFLEIDGKSISPQKLEWIKRAKPLYK